jgi:O-antigen/teichoic acid export membrane protein
MRNSLVGTSARTAVVYALALGLLFVGELAVARVTSAKDFGSYQLVRNALPVLTTIGLLGYDQALVRELARSGASRAVRLGRDQYTVIGMSVIAAACTASYLWLALALDSSVMFVLPLCTYLLSYSIMVASSMRALGHTAGAAFAYQGYRLIAGSTLLLVSFGPVSHGAPLFVVLLLAAAGPFWFSYRWLRGTDFAEVISTQRHRSIRSLGAVFSLAAITMAASDWLDQLLVSMSHLGLEGNGNYALAKLLAVYPLSSVAAVAGFVALAEVTRRSASLTLARFARVAGVCSLVSLGLACGAFAAARFVGSREFGLDLPHSVFALLAVVGALRLFYVLPSAVFGAIGSTRMILAFGLVGFLTLALQVAITMRFGDGVSLVSACQGLLAASAARLIASVVFCLILLRNGSRR